MKRIISVAICLLMLLPCCIPFASAKKEKETESTSFVFEIDVNQRYTDIIDATEDAEYYQLHNNEDEEKQAQTRRNTYIAVLISALVVSVIVLIVSLKRVPKEEDVDISGQNKIKKDKNDKE
ncbi:MAG: hypothetical protein E7529_02190 [Ruminococcaceae bacterium]|nr:hypothetical protein [Oscillospiraceae bacterium]